MICRGTKGVLEQKSGLRCLRCSCWEERNIFDVHKSNPCKSKMEEWLNHQTCVRQPPNTRQDETWAAEKSNIFRPQKDVSEFCFLILRLRAYIVSSVWTNHPTPQVFLPTQCDQCRCYWLAVSMATLSFTSLLHILWDISLQSKPLRLLSLTFYILINRSSSLHTSFTESCGWKQLEL